MGNPIVYFRIATNLWSNNKRNLHNQPDIIKSNLSNV